jgi:hypothetical protein
VHAPLRRIEQDHQQQQRNIRLPLLLLLLLLCTRGSWPYPLAVVRCYTSAAQQQFKINTVLSLHIHQAVNVL